MERGPSASRVRVMANFEAINGLDPDMRIEGILNGDPPFSVRLENDFDDLCYVVVDAEDSVLARVNGGEEMAEFFAYCLNRIEKNRLIVP